MSSRISFHEGVRCDACSRTNFRGKRYKCLICFDYDLCETCYEEGVTDTVHKTEHAVQCILTPQDYDLYYGGEAAEQPQSFTCPMCATMGFTPAGLREHLSSEHVETETHVVCPVCAATPGGNANHVTADLAAHLTLEHSRNRDILDEQAASRRLPRASPTGLRGAIGSSVRGRRPLRQLPPAVSSVPPLPPPIPDSTGAMSGLFSQISTGPRRTSTLPLSGGAATDIQQFRMRLQVARQQAQTALRQQNRPPLRDPIPAVTSTNPVAVVRFPEPVLPRPKPILVEPPAPDDSRFLLTAYVEPSPGDSQQQAIEVERADRSLFLQELLLGTLEAPEPAGADGKRCESNASADVTRSARHSPSTGREPAATITTEKTKTIRPHQNLTSSPEPIVTYSQELSVSASQEPTPPSSFEPSAERCLGLTVAISVEPITSRISGLTIDTSPAPTTPATPGVDCSD